MVVSDTKKNIEELLRFNVLNVLTVPPTAVMYRRPVRILTPYATLLYPSTTPGPKVLPQKHHEIPLNQVPLGSHSAVS